MKNNASLVYGFFLVIGDFLALIAAFVSAYVLRVTLDDRPLVAQVAARDYLEAFLYVLPIWLLIFAFIGLYSKNTFENRFSEFGRLLVGCFLGILVMIGYEYITEVNIFPARLVPVYGLGLAFAFLLLFRTIARAVRRSLFSFGIGVSNVLIVGDSTTSQEFIESISETKVTGYRVVGVVGRVPGDKHHSFKSFQAAVKALDKVGVHSVIQTELYADPIKNAEILAFTQENHVSYRFVPGNSELFTGKIDVDLFYSVPVIAVHQTPLIGWGRIVKRLFDLVFGLAFLILAIIPILLIAIIVKLSDPKGKILYKPLRLGRYGKTFKCYKFRSMYQKYNMSPEDGFAKMGRLDLLQEYRANGDKLDKDPRVTPIGRFIRKYSLDELPQLFNVIKGDISLVGPRALDHFELDSYDKKSLILSVKTGLTGLAVVSGRSDIPFEERRKLDLYYVQNWSFWGDIVILLRTFSVVLFHRGAR